MPFQVLRQYPKNRPLSEPSFWGGRMAPVVLPLMWNVTLRSQNLLPVFAFISPLTSYHNISGLKHRKWSYGSAEVWCGYHWLTPGCHGAALFLETTGGESVPLPRPAYRGCPHSLLIHDPLSPPSSQQHHTSLGPFSPFHSLSLHSLEIPGSLLLFIF